MKIQISLCSASVYPKYSMLSVPLQVKFLNSLITNVAKKKATHYLKKVTIDGVLDGKSGTPTAVFPNVNGFNTRLKELGWLYQPYPVSTRQSAVWVRDDGTWPLHINWFGAYYVVVLSDKALT